MRFDVYMLNFVLCGRFYNFVRDGAPYNDVISQESRDLNFRLFIYAYSLLPQTYFRSSLTRVLTETNKTDKSKYPEEYSTSIK